VLAELGGLDAVPEDGEAADGGAGRDDDDDDGEAADEEVEEIELGGDEGEDGEPVDDGNGYENARKKEPLGPDTSTARFEGHGDSVYCVAVSPTVPVAVSGGGDDVAYLWSTATGARIATLSGHTDSVVAAGFSCDGKLVATGSYDATVRVRCCAEATERRVVGGRGAGWMQGPTIVLAVAPDHGSVLTGCFDGCIAPVPLTQTHHNSPSSFSPIPTYCCARAQVWDAATGELLHTLDGPGGEVEWLAWHPRGPVVLAGSADGTVWMWDVTRRALANCMQVFAGHEEGVTAGGFDPSGKAVYTGSADGGVRAFNPKTAACMHSYRLDAPVNALAFHPSPDKPLLAVGTQDGVAAVINTATSKVLVRVQHTPPEELAEKAAARAAAAAAAADGEEAEDDADDPATRSVERCVQGCVAAPDRAPVWALAQPQCQGTQPTHRCVHFPSPLPPPPCAQRVLLWDAPVCGVGRHRWQRARVRPGLVSGALPVGARRGGHACGVPAGVGGAGGLHRRRAGRVLRRPRRQRGRARHGPPRHDH
jgi:WD40 repeat protein